MRSLLRLITLVLTFGGWALAALSLHVVVTPQRVLLIPKSQIGITDTYVDTRGWNLEAASAHPVLLDRLLRAGRAEVLKHVTDAGSVEDLQSQLADALRRGQEKGTTTQPALEQAVGWVRKVEWN